ncbi:MAG: hypothetical protein KC416_05430 [Myxococcales bacterium]|nr:hypothetical protein [Myxococcales bacterium]
MAPSTFQIIALVFGAFVLGILVPLMINMLLGLRRTLQEARETLASVRRVSAKIDRATNESDLAELVQGVAATATEIARISRVGSAAGAAIGPAAAAFISALRSPSPEQSPPEASGAHVHAEIHPIRPVTPTQPQAERN